MTSRLFLTAAGTATRYSAAPIRPTEDRSEIQAAPARPRDCFARDVAAWACRLRRFERRRARTTNCCQEGDEPALFSGRFERKAYLASYLTAIF
jgi:hypothetical protein